MASLRDLLASPYSNTSSVYDLSNDSWFKHRHSTIELERSSAVPRLGFLPEKLEDFGGGGAFPEFHVSQYPLGMGCGETSVQRSTILAVSVDAEGNVAYEAIVKRNENAESIVYTRHKDLIPKILRDEGEVDADEGLRKEIEETMEETKSALEKIVNARLIAAQSKNVPKQSGDSKHINYKPTQHSAAFNSGAKERIIRVVEMPVDPLEPPKFKHKRVPKACGSMLVPVMRSPPRPLTVEDRENWRIVPCVSLWKNQKGYTIPLDKRQTGDGNVAQEVGVDNSALVEALHVAEQKAREAVAMRTEVQQEMMMREKERKGQELWALAERARSERTEHMPSESRRERLQRERLRDERRREREKERMMECKDAAMGKKRKITRDIDRDMSEKVALGMASIGTTGGEVMYDQRLFNQDRGMGSGFTTDDQYNVYDKGLFTAPPTLSTLYKPKTDMDEEMYGNADKHIGKKLMKTDRFKAEKAFSETSERTGKRDRPVEFEKEAVEADPYGMDSFVAEVMEGNKAMNKAQAPERSDAGNKPHCATQIHR